MTPKFDTLVIFTDRFPFGEESECSFLMPELEAAARVFKRVIVVPSSAGGERADCKLPANVEIDLYQANSLAGRSRIFRGMAALIPGVIIRSKGDMSRNGLTFGAAAWHAAKTTDKWIEKRGVNVETTLFHTFWFDIMAGAMALLAIKRNINWVSSAHGFDIYTRRGGRLRELMLQRVNRVFCASESGAEFMRGRYKEYAGKILTRTLGSPDGVRASAHEKEERKLTFLSVSNVIGLKRVELNAELLIALAKGRTGTHVHWIHVGDGALLKSIKRKLETDNLPDNFTYELRGKLSNDDVHRIYAGEKIDWFMLLSRYEGGNPIAVCEALSHGVPVIATDTTGLSEAVDDDCAILLPLNPEKEEFVRGILPYLESDFRYEKMRESARRRWERKFNSGRLRKDFYQSL